MATNIDRTYYQAPVGTAVEDGPDIEIEIEEAPELNSEEGLTVVFGEELTEMDVEFGANLAESIPEDALAGLISDLVSEVDEDKRSRKDWEDTYKEGLQLLGLKYEDRTEPWPGACGVHHPMITEAIVRFQSEATTEMFPAKGPCLTKILGTETREKTEASHRVREEMNHQLTDVMTEFRPEHERMLWSLPGVGSAFKKVYDDPTLGRQTSVFVPAEDVLLPYGCSDINTSPRVTHVMKKTKNEILKLQAKGFYRDVEIGDPTQEKDEIQEAKDKQTGFSQLNEEYLKIYEIQAEMDLPGFEDVGEAGEPTGVHLPYIITVLADTEEVLGIRRNWAEDDKLRIKAQHFVHYQYIPGFGAYGFGLFHLIGGYAKSATSILRQLVDAGTLSNLPGGLKTRGLRIKGDDVPISPGEFRDVDIGSGNIKDNILPLPYKEPSAVLAGLLEKIIEEGRRFAATADIKISDMSAQAPVGTTLALLERTLKVMTAVQARMHASLKLELKLIAAIIRDHTQQDYSYETSTDQPRARREDFSKVDIIPVSDPNAATMAQRVVQYQAVVQLAAMAPDIYDLPELHRQMLDVLGVKQSEKLVPLKDDIKPMDPVTENMAALNGKPIKAFMYQDHDAHLAVHTAAMQDPMIMQTLGQNPKANMIMAAAAAHIAEHTAYKYRQQIEQQMGTSLPPEGEELPPEIESALSAMMAKAAQQALMQNKQAAAQQKAQQQAQDPLMQIEMRKLAVEEGNLKLAERKVQIEALEKADKLALAEKQFKVAAADKADKTRLAERKQLADEELGEQNTRLKAVHYGNMGRAQDQSILIKDREQAMQAMQALLAYHQSDSLGVSGEPARQAEAAARQAAGAAAAQVENQQQPMQPPTPPEGGTP